MAEIMKIATSGLLSLAAGIAILCLLGTLPSGSLHAAPDTTGYSLTVVPIPGVNAFNLPELVLANQSDPGISITGLDLTG